jgi:hypothetical protein
MNDAKTREENLNLRNPVRKIELRLMRRVIIGGIFNYGNGHLQLMSGNYLNGYKHIDSSRDNGE